MVLLQLSQQGQLDLQSGGCSPPLQNPLQKDTPHCLQPQKAKYDPQLYLAQGPQSRGQLANWRSADEPMPSLMQRVLCDMEGTSIAEENGE